MATDKDTRKVLDQLEAQGWTIKYNKKGHPMAYPPDASLGFVTFAGTASDHRSLKNAIAQCRRRGAVL